MIDLGASARKYYDLSPASDNQPGDIWSGLPTHGLIGTDPLYGMVITPACDLSNRKVETITYLPIIPVLAYFSSIAFLPELRRTVDGLLENSSLRGLIEWPDSSFPPELSLLALAKERLRAVTENPHTNGKEKSYLQRVASAIRILENMASPNVKSSKAEDLSDLLGEKRWQKIREDIVSNSLRGDLHFLPRDGQDTAWSGVPEHSLVLFRYPLTAPIEVFECAQDVGLLDWDAAVSKVARIKPMANSFRSVRPLKRIRLLPRFVADLLTRYISIYIRIGSPDFTRNAISRLSTEIGYSV
jgi:hypothetical protein